MNDARAVVSHVDVIVRMRKHLTVFGPPASRVLALESSRPFSFSDLDTDIATSAEYSITILVPHLSTLVLI